MQYGICTSPENTHLYAAAGFDFIELNVQQFLQGEAEESAFLAEWEKVRTCGLPSRAANAFIPGHLAVTGPKADLARLETYAQTICRRAEIAGLKTIVFGSGGARMIPEGFDRAHAWEQLLDFGRMASEVAARHGVTIVAEPLNKKECNVLNSVGECAKYVREINHSNMRLLADSYHWWQDDNDEAALIEAASLLHHVHLATAANRIAPGEEPADFSRFLALLNEGGYRGPISIEATWRDAKKNAARAFEIISTR